MGFLDSVFDDNGMIGRLGETLQDAAWFVGAPFGAAIDIAKAGLPGGEPALQGAVKAITTGAQRGTQLFFGDENDQGNADDDRPNIFSPAVKEISDALEFVYDNALAQPINTANILSQRGLADVVGVEDNASPFDVSSAWERADEKTGGYGDKGTSVGREWANLVTGLNDLMPGNWSREGRFGSLTSEGQQALDEHSRVYDIQSGTVDATARLFLDPTIVLGKAAKVLRTTKAIAGIKDADQIAGKLAETGKSWGMDGWGDRFDKALGWAAQPNRSAGELVAAFPGLRDNLDGPAIASVMEQTNKVMRAQGKSDDEVLQQFQLISRASLGDMDAMKAIDESAAFAKDALAAMKTNRDDLKTASEWATQYSDRVTPEEIADAAQTLDLVKDLQLRGEDYFTSDKFVKLTNERLKSVSKDIRAAEDEAARQVRVRNLFKGTDDTVGAFSTLKDRPMLSAAIPVKGGTRGLEKRAARERGENVGLDFVFQSTAWNKGVKYLAPHIYLGERAVHGFNKMAQPRMINVHDERAALELDNFLKHSKLDGETRLGLVSRLAAARSEQEKGHVVEESISRATESILRSYREGNPHFTDEVEKEVLVALAKVSARDRTRTAAHTQMFTAHKTTVDQDGVPAGSRGDLRIGDDGEAEFYPLLDTQLVNQFALPDLRRTEHILRRHSNWMTDMAAWAKGDRAPDPNRIKEISERVYGKTVDLRPGFDVRTANRAQAVNDFVWKSEENAKLVLEGFTRIWKYGALALRPVAYAVRVNVDSGMRMAAALGPAAWVMHSSPRVFGYATLGGASRARQVVKSFRDSQREIELRKAMERLEDKWNADELGRRTDFDGAVEDRRLVRYDEEGAPTTAASKPFGLYFSFKREGVESPYKSFGPKETNAFRNPDANILEVSGTSTAGMLALRKLVPESQVAPALRMSTKDLAAKLSKEFPGQDYSKHDTLMELMEIWGAQVAKKKGYDGIVFRSADRSISEFDEYVALTDNALAEAPKYERQGVDVDPEYAALKAEHATLATRLDLYRTGGRKGRRDAYGAFGESGYKPIQTRAGELEGAFSTQQGRTNRWIVSSQTSAAIMGDSSKLALKTAQLGNWTYITNKDPLHLDNWKHAVNSQLMQSVIGKRAVQFMNEFNDAERASARLARWATGTPEGREVMGKLQWTGADKTRWSREVVGYVNHYLPSRELRKTAATKGKVDQIDLETAIPNVENRPPVHGEGIAMATGRGSVLGEQINNIFSSVMRWASDATEDQLARHPMYAAVYEQEAKRRAEFLMADSVREHMSLDEVQRLVQDQAHKKARQAIKNYMFDVAATSDVSHYMRFVSPFIAAWEDTVRKWGRIAVENPDIAGKAYLVWNAPNDLGIVVDEDGNPVESDTFTDKTYIVIPRGIGKHLPGGGDSDFKISKQAFNLVLQGGLQPGFGPLVAYPVGKIQTAAPALNDVAKIVNPYGPPSGFVDAVAPSVVKALYDATQDQSRAHQQDTRRIYAQMLTEYRLDPEKFGGKEPQIDEAARRAGALGRIKILNRVVGLPLPGFPAIFQSPYQMYIDAYRTLSERERAEGHPHGWADHEFITGYGETYFPLVQSESKNNAGVGASANAVDAANQYRPLINKYGVEAGQAKPNLIRLIIGQEGEGDFNESAHLWQQQQEISPASGIKYRDYENPQEAQAQADADLGWYKYRQFMNTMDAMALEQGLRTYADDPELVATRREFIDNLQGENESWHVEWSQRDSDAFERDLQALGEVANSGRFGPMRTDMQGVQQYLGLRTALIQQLQEFEITPGSQDAIPFKQEFTDAVMGLVSSNSQFAEWSYYTFLERDPLLEPVTEQVLQTAPTDWGFDGLA